MMGTHQRHDQNLSHNPQQHQFNSEFCVMAGMYILAGFSDKLRLMNLLIDDIKTFREFNVRNCSACAFSCGGHLLAAVSGNVVSVFSSVNFRNTVRHCNIRRGDFFYCEGTVIDCVKQHVGELERPRRTSDGDPLV